MPSMTTVQMMTEMTRMIRMRLIIVIIIMMMIITMTENSDYGLIKGTSTMKTAIMMPMIATKMAAMTRRTKPTIKKNNNDYNEN